MAAQAHVRAVALGARELAWDERSSPAARADACEPWGADVGGGSQVEARSYVGPHVCCELATGLRGDTARTAEALV